jgi:hypothetical protein
VQRLRGVAEAVQQEHRPSPRRVARDRTRTTDDPVAADFQSRGDLARQRPRRPATAPEQCANGDRDGDQ